MTPDLTTPMAEDEDVLRAIARLIYELHTGTDWRRAPTDPGADPTWRARVPQRGAGCWQAEPAPVVASDGVRNYLAALALVGKRVRFAHQPDAPGHYQVVRRATAAGRVELDGWSGEFAAHLFVVVE